LEIGEMRAGLGFELREILALRSALRRLAVVIGAGLLQLRVDERHCCACRIKCQTDSLFGEIAGVALIDRVTGEAGGLHFGGGVAVPGDDGAEVVDNDVAA
jgi:hypothetical protein